MVQKRTLELNETEREVLVAHRDHDANPQVRERCAAILKIAAGQSAYGVAREGFTVIGVIATNARLTKEEANKLAQMAQDGVAQAVRPAHTPFDGDTIFALATGEVQSDLSLVGAFAAEVVVAAIRNAVRMATSLGRVLAVRDLL